MIYSIGCEKNVEDSFVVDGFKQYLENLESILHYGESRPRKLFKFSKLKNKKKKNKSEVNCQCLNCFKSVRNLLGTMYAIRD